MMATTTLNQIRDHSPCPSGWSELLRYLGKHRSDDETLSFNTILKAVGMEDAIWCLRVLGNDRRVPMFALACARNKLAQAKTDELDDELDEALTVAELWMKGVGTHEDLVCADRLAWEQVDAYYFDPVSRLVAYTLESVLDYANNNAPWVCVRYCNSYFDAQPEQKEEIFLSFFGEENANNPEQNKS